MCVTLKFFPFFFWGGGDYHIAVFIILKIIMDELQKKPKMIIPWYSDFFLLNLSFPERFITYGNTRNHFRKQSRITIFYRMSKHIFFSTVQKIYWNDHISKTKIKYMKIMTNYKSYSYFSLKSLQIHKLSFAIYGNLYR